MIISGYIEDKSFNGGDYEAISVDGKSSLAETIYDGFEGVTVSVRYWICNKECSKEEASELFVKTLFGEVDSKAGAAYSEVTGFLWFDEEAKIGGHDLMEELRSNIGKFLILEIEQPTKEVL